MNKETKEKTIQEILGESFLSKFKIVWRETLFEPAWDALKIDRCPICGNKLKRPRVRKIAYCNGKKHAKPFFINLDRLEKIKSIDYEKVKNITPYKNM